MNALRRGPGGTRPAGTPRAWQSQGYPKRHPSCVVSRRSVHRARSPVEPRRYQNKPALDHRQRPSARDVHKSFGSGPHRSPVLRGVSMEAARGETVFLVGPSGSGKTTLLSILGCILTPDRGSVQVLGQEVAGDDAGRADRRSAATTSASSSRASTCSRRCRPWTTCALALAMRRRAAAAGHRQRAAELLDQVGLWHRRTARPAQLSSGECQRVAIARALADDPAVLFADEPTASLDAENGQAVMKLLTRLVRERGVTLVVVTHDNRIFPFADRILRLEDGCMAHEWVPTEAAPSRPSRRRAPPERLRFLKEHVA